MSGSSAVDKVALGQSEQQFRLASFLRDDWQDKGIVGRTEASLAMESIGVQMSAAECNALTNHPSSFNLTKLTPSLLSRVESLDSELREGHGKLMDELVHNPQAGDLPFYRQVKVLLYSLCANRVHFDVLGQIECRSDEKIGQFGLQWQEGLDAWEPQASLGQMILNRVEKLYAVKDLHSEISDHLANIQAVETVYPMLELVTRKAQQLNVDLTVESMSEAPRIWTPLSIAEMTLQFFDNDRAYQVFTLKTMPAEVAELLQREGREVDLDKRKLILDALDALELLRVWNEKFKTTIYYALALSERYARWAGQVRHMTA